MALEPNEHHAEHGCLELKRWLSKLTVKLGPEQAMADQRPAMEKALARAHD